MPEQETEDRVKYPDARKYFESTHKALLTERGDFEADWKEIARYMMPQYGRFFDGYIKRGHSDYADIINNTAKSAGMSMASGLMAAGPSPAKPWFRLGVEDMNLFEQGEVKQYLTIVEELMRQVFSRSNFYDVFHQLLLEAAFFGNGGFMLLEDAKDSIRCYNMTLGEYVMGQDGRNEHNICYRSMQKTVYQLLDMFGYDALSQHSKTKLKQGQGHVKIKVVQAVMPSSATENLERFERLPFDDKPFVSVYWEDGQRDRDFLEISGYEEFPAIFFQFNVIGSDAYGWGPGLDVLGDGKGIQFWEILEMTGMEKEANPPLKHPSSISAYDIDDDPGGRTAVDVTQGDGLDRLYDTRFNPVSIENTVQRMQDRIRVAFFEDLFKALLNDMRSSKTAREIQELHQEKLLQLGPTSERIHRALKAVIDRTFMVMHRNGELPEPPEALQGKGIKVEFISVLAQAQKATGTAPIDGIIAYIGGLNSITGTTDALDKFDTDQSIEMYADLIGVPPVLIVPDDDVQAARQARADQREAAQNAEMAASAAQTGKDMAETPVQSGGSTVLDQLLGANR